MKLKLTALLLVLYTGLYAQNKIVLTAPRLDTSSLSNRINLKANTNLNNVNGVLSSTYGGAGSVSGILKANGSGVVSAAVNNSDFTLLNGTGFVRMSGTTPSYLTGASSQFVKADGSLDGNTYATTGALSGYLPLTAGFGQNLTGDLYLTGLSGGRGIYLNENDSYASTFLLQAGGGSAGWGGGIIMYGHSHPTKAGWITAGISSGSSGKFSVNTQGLGAGTDVFTVGHTGIVTATNTLSGTSLSMSGAGRMERVQVGTSGTLNDLTGVGQTLQFGNYTAGSFISGIADNFIYKTSSALGGLSAQSLILQTRSDVSGGGVAFVYGSTPAVGLYMNGNGNVLINTTTESPNNEALQVAGSGLFTGAITASSSVTANSFVTTGTVRTTNPSDTSYYGLFSNDGAMIFDAYGAGTFSLFKVNGTAVLSVDASGAVISGTSRANGYLFAYSTKSSNYTLTNNDDYIVVTNASTITLPTAVGRAGKRYVIRSTAGSGVSSSLTTTSGQTIDGILPFPSPFSFGFGNYNILIVFSDGANWFSETFITGG